MNTGVNSVITTAGENGMSLARSEALRRRLPVSMRLIFPAREDQAFPAVSEKLSPLLIAS